MTEQEILAGLGEIVEEIAGVPADEVTPNKSFVDDLDIDSLSMVEIAVAAQVDAASPPSGVVAPSPVTTTVSRSMVTPIPRCSWPRSSLRPGRW